MSAIIELARRLGRAIAGSSQAADLKAAREQLDSDEDTSRCLTEYREQAEKVARLEQDNKPVDVDDKHKLKELQGRLVSSETFKKYSAAQVEYVDLMRKVHDVLSDELAETEGAEEDAAADTSAG